MSRVVCFKCSCFIRNTQGNPYVIHTKHHKQSIFEKWLRMDHLRIDHIAAYDDKVILQPLAFQSQILEKHLFILFDWMHEVLLTKCKNVGRISVCLCTATGLVHCVLQKRDVSLSRLQLLGATAVTLATKFEYGTPAHLSLKTMVCLCDNAYVLKELQEMEVLILNTVGWSVFVSGPWSHTRPFLEMVLVQNGLCDMKPNTKDLVLHFEAVSVYLLHMMAYSTSLLRQHYYPLLAMCVAGMAACACGMEHWKSPLDHGYGLHPDRMVCVIMDMQSLATQALKKLTRSNRLEMCRWVGINTKLDDATMPSTLVPMFKKLIDFDFSEYFV